MREIRGNKTNPMYHYEESRDTTLLRKLMTTIALNYRFDLNDVYGPEQAPKQTVRYQKLFDEFEQRFGQKPEFVVRSPGRVNLIGEHIDYSGYCVLPMAIEKDVVIVGSVVTGTCEVQVQNTNKKFSAFTLRCDEDLFKSDSVTPAGRWSSYVAGGFKIALQQAPPATVLNGAKLLVDGQVPIAGGLSSSAALSCASFMAALRVSPTVASAVGTLERAAELAAIGERSCGVDCGGMDQAASILGERGAAKLISFAPMRARTVPLPRNAAFVVANSMVESEKAQTAKMYYNRRVLECRMAAMLIVQSPEQTINAIFQPRHGTILRDAVVQIADRPPPAHGSLERIHDAATANVGGAASWPSSSSSLSASTTATNETTSTATGDGKFSVREVFRRTHREGNGALAFDAFVQSRLGIAPNDVVVDEQFNIGYRLRHVLDEAERVIRFAAVGASVTGQIGIDSVGRFELQNGAALAADNDRHRVDELGRLMNASHESCAKYYECSCSELDELVGVARGAGAIGARLTGAGWGGCVVVLLDTDRTPINEFLAVVKRDYYAKRGITDASVLDSALFVTRPSAGARVMNL